MSFKLYNGDCLEIMKAIPDNSIDLIFCDLPYGNITKCKWDCPIDLNKLWKEYKRIKKERTPIFLCCNTMLGVDLIKSTTIPFKYELIWKKSQSSNHFLSSKQPLRLHEFIYVFYDKAPFYDLSSHKSLYKTNKKTSYNSIYGSNPITNHGIIGKSTGTPRYDPPLPTSILEIASQRTKHSTQKPVDLMKFCLKYYSKENDIILDNCMGSGSTGVACKEMNRRFIGIEMDKDIFKVAEERLNSV